MTQNQITILTLIISFVGGGTVSALINWIRTSLSESKARSMKYIEEQINNLYGPLYFLTSQSQKLFDIEKKLDDTYKTEIIDQKFSDDPIARQRVREEADHLINLKNRYIDEVVKNNLNIRDLLDNKFALIDADDIDVFINYFYEHFVRYQIEQTHKTPLMVYEHLGEISFLRPEFISKVKQKFELKKKQL